MKKGTIIALAALVLVLVAFFLTRPDVKTTVEPPYVVKHVADLGRIELTRPDGVVVLEQSEAGWALSKPIGAPLAESVVADLNAAFGSDIKTDDLKVSSDKAADYELTDKGVKVTLFAAGASGPTTEFTVGKELKIEGTNARRTFILNDKGRAFRAQAALDFLRKPVDELRSRNILTADRDRITKLQVTRGESVVVLEKRDGWKMTAPQADMPLETSVVEGAVTSLARLRAMAFADSRKPEEIGLSPPMFVIEAEAGSATLKLELGQSGEDWFARIPGEPFIYQVSPSTGMNLALDATKLRDRVPLRIAEIEAVEFAGADRAFVSRTGESWSMVRPSKHSVPDDKMASRLTALEALRVNRYVDMDLAAAGLSSAKERVVVRGGGVKHELILGAQVEDTQDRYARWDGLPFVFVLPKFIVDRLSPSVDELTKT